MSQGISLNTIMGFNLVTSALALRHTENSVFMTRCFNSNILHRKIHKNSLIN